MVQKIKRKHTKIVRIGNISIGGPRPIAVQSMVKVPAKNVRATLNQIRTMQACGGEIVRLAVKDAEDAKALSKIKKQSTVALVADIHFNYRFALAALEAGFDKIRLNPGNIYKKDEVKAVAQAARQRNIPIRVGSNSGSLRRSYQKTKSVVQSLVQQTHDYTKMLEDYGIQNIVISLKSSDMFQTEEAYRKMSRLCAYPLHVGVTATGLLYDGIVKSSIGIASLLKEGIGDTLRVSLLGSPEDEITVAYSILSSMDLRQRGPQYICCPTCGRCEVNLQKKVEEFSRKLSARNLKDSSRLRIALMGCMVNGPGEAQHADWGIAFGKARGVLFKKGSIVETIAENRCIDRLIKKIK